jgi:hypothetical protein
MMMHRIETDMGTAGPALTSSQLGPGAPLADIFFGGSTGFE